MTLTSILSTSKRRNKDDSCCSSSSSIKAATNAPADDLIDSSSSSPLAPLAPPSVWLTFCASTLYHISLHFPLAHCTVERCFIVIVILPPVFAGILWQRIEVAMSRQSSDNSNNYTDTALLYLYVLLLILLLLAMISYLSFCFKVSQAYCKNRINASNTTLQARAKAAAAASTSTSSSSSSSIPRSRKPTSPSTSPPPARVVFEDGYDLYLPPHPPPAPPPQDAANGSSNNNTQNHHSTTSQSNNDDSRKVVPCGFFLFPGALVDYRSYATFAMQLSDAGIVVIVQNTEPFRFVSWIFGSNHKFCLNTMHKVQTRYNLHIQEWNVGGHSMGGYTCYNLVHQLPGVFQKLALYGVYRPMSLRNAGVDVLVVTASRDGFNGFTNNDQAKHQFFDSLPPLLSSSSFVLSTSLSSSLLKNASSSLTVSTTSSATSTEPQPPCSNSSNGTTNSHNRSASTKNRTIHYDIHGGNHAGFGDNWIQTFPRMDGERTISLEEQHAQMAKVTCHFLLNMP